MHTARSTHPSTDPYPYDYSLIKEESQLGISRCACSQLRGVQADEGSRLIREQLEGDSWLAAEGYMIPGETSCISRELA